MRGAAALALAAVIGAAPATAAAREHLPSTTGSELAGPPPGASAWVWPVAPRLVRPYLAPATPYAAGHRGIDLRAAPGDEVRAVADGTVHFAGVVVDRPVVSLRHAGGVLSSFEAVASSFARGDPVSAGDVIGTIAPGGHCAGTCLHVGARVDGGYVSPMLFLGGIPRAVLLPTRRGRAAPAALAAPGRAGRGQAGGGQARRGQARGCAVR